nr:glycosyltransferase family 2 protein [Priestia megaterium]
MRLKVSVIIPACNEADSLLPVIKEVQKMKPFEIIVVVNGSSDTTKEIAEGAGCRVVYYEEALGINIGRAIGAKKAKGDILLFLDGDIAVPHEELMKYTKAIETGHDIALNNLSWIMKRKVRPHPVSVAKYMLNLCLQREDLSIQALTAIPHAIKKTSAAKIGYENLAHPPLAHTIALLKGMSIVAPCSSDVIYTNKIRTTHKTIPTNSPFPISTNYIIGDHIKALAHLIEEKGIRGGLTDGDRNREVVSAYTPNVKRKTGVKYSAVIPAGEEKETIANVIKEVRKAGVEEIIVVANGADEVTVKRAIEAGATVLHYKQRLGHNVPRAIGAMYSSGEVCLFVDGDIVISAEHLRPYLEAADQGVDVALNNLECLLDEVHPIHSVSAAKYFLNIVCKRPDLTINTTTAIPHAIKRDVMEKVGYESLIIPPLFQLKSIMYGFMVQPVHFVDVARTNRIRKEHMKVKGLAASTQRILGDYVEAMAYYISQTSERGEFLPDIRRHDILFEVLKNE